MTEHKCVLDTRRHQHSRASKVPRYRRSSRTAGRLPDALRAAITDKTVLVSVMAVNNNEIGVIQPLARSARPAASARSSSTPTWPRPPATFAPRSGDEHRPDEHLGSQRSRPQGNRALASAASRACGWSRGLSMANGAQGARLPGSGTLPTRPLCVGLGEACEIAMKEMGAEAKRLANSTGVHAEGPAGQARYGHRRQRRPGASHPGSPNISFATSKASC